MEEILYNVKLTAAMKNQILRDVSDIFDYSGRGDMTDELGQSIGSCILALMLLSRRCGISIETLHEHMMDRINTGLCEGHVCETRFNDLSVIAKFIRSGKNESCVIKGRQGQR